MFPSIIPSPRGPSLTGTPSVAAVATTALPDADSDFQGSSSTLPTFATINPTAGRTVTLPAASECEGRWFVLKNLAGGQTPQVDDQTAGVGNAIANSSTAYYFCDPTLGWTKMLELGSA